MVIGQTLVFAKYLHHRPFSARNSVEEIKMADRPGKSQNSASGYSRLHKSVELISDHKFDKVKNDRHIWQESTVGQNAAKSQEDIVGL